MNYSFNIILELNLYFIITYWLFVVQSIVKCRTLYSASYILNILYFTLVVIQYNNNIMHYNVLYTLNTIFIQIISELINYINIAYIFIY